MLDINGLELIPVKFKYFNLRLAAPQHPADDHVNLTSPEYDGVKAISLTENYSGSGHKFSEYVYNFETHELTNTFTYDMTKYMQLTPYKDELYYFEKNDESAGLMNKAFEIVESVKKDRILERYGNGVYASMERVTGKNVYTTTYTYLNSNNNVIAQGYNYVEHPIMNHPEYFVFNKLDKTPTRYTDFFDARFGEHLTLYHEDEKLKYNYGLMDNNGEIIIEPKYDRIYEFEYPLADLFLVNNNKKYGFVDLQGNIVHDLVYDEVKLVPVDEQNQYAVVAQNGKYGVIDNLGNEIFPCVLDNEVIGYSEGLFIASHNWKWGAFNTNGDTIIPFIYDTKVDYVVQNGLAQFGRGTNSISHDAHGVLHINTAQKVLLSTKNELMMELHDNLLTSWRNQYFVINSGQSSTLYKYTKLN